MHLEKPLLPILLATFTLAACGGTSSTEEPTTSPPISDVADGTDEPPAEDGAGADNGFGVTARSPERDASNGALVGNITVTFNEPLIASTVSSETVMLEQNGSAIAANVLHDDGSATVIVQPRGALEPHTEYTVRLSSSIMAEDGTQLEDHSWTFTTAGQIGATPQAVIDQCMAASDLQMLDQLNRARAASRSCGDEAKPAVGPLAWNCAIRQAAQGHSDDMASNNFFSHTGSDGLTLAERLAEAGYQWSAAAENIAAGQRTVDEVMQAWLDSPGHCVNIMGENYSEVGAAVAENPDSQYGLYWTQNFGRPR